METTTSPFVDTSEAAGILGVSRATLSRMTKGGILEAHYSEGPGSGHRRASYRRDQIEAYKSSQVSTNAQALPGDEAAEFTAPQQLEVTPSEGEAEYWKDFAARAAGVAVVTTSLVQELLSNQRSA